MTPILSLLTTFFISITVNGQYPLPQFYPYGFLVGDSQLPPEDDTSIPVPISFDYPFFGSVYREVQITTNGIITFGFADPAFVPEPFPLKDNQCVSSYWTDLDPGRGGNVHFRQTYDQRILDSITQEIRNNLVEYRSFSSQWALIVTFENVPPFGCGGDHSEDGCSVPCSRVAMFQTVLTTNGIHSFAIFSFNRLDYTVGNAVCEAHAQIGFNAGDERRFYLVRMSNTPNISQVALTESNVGVSGHWIFPTDGEEILEGCNTVGLLEVYPRKLLYFGNEEVFISGPCFASDERIVTVLFSNAAVVCNVNSALLAICRTPQLTKLGRNEIKLSHRSINYNSFVVAVGADDDSVGDSVFTTQQTANKNADYVLEWTPITGEGSSIIFKGYQNDFYMNSWEEIVAEDETPLDYGSFTNNGRVSLRIATSQRQSQYSKMVRQILISGTIGNTRRIAGQVIILVNIDTYSSCINWYLKQPLPQEMDTIWDELARRSPCPPGVAPHYPPVLDDFERDGSCNVDGGMCHYFHSTAKGCYRSTNNNGGKVSQCCYEGTNHTLILGPDSGGRMHFVDSGVSTKNHFRQDILPYLTCCKLSSECHFYYDKRPSIDSTYFRPRNGSGGGGDPHFTTLDGTKYTFNAIGEFVYMHAKDANDGTESVIHARISQYKDISGNLKPACYFSAFVVRSGLSDIVQVELAASQTFGFRVNGQSVILDEGLWNFDGISISYENNATVKLYTTTTGPSISLELNIIGRMLHAILNLPNSLKGNVIGGLTGDWDGNSTNDLRLPNGTLIPADSTNEDIHYKFGLAWTTTSATSLFSYPRGLTWADYHNASFVPDFSAPSNDTMAVCGGNLDCAYDIEVTSDVAAGQSNLMRQAKVTDINEINEVISSKCPTQVSVANGIVTVNVDGATTHYTVECFEGNQLAGNDHSTCERGIFTPLGVCQPLTQPEQPAPHPDGSTSISGGVGWVLLSAIITRTFMIIHSC